MFALITSTTELDKRVRRALGNGRLGMILKNPRADTEKKQRQI
jgi:hypothetical protein